MDTEIDLSHLSEKLKQNEGCDLKNPDLISDITNKRITFVSIIESLSEVLTNQYVTIRERGVSFLSWILSEIPPDLFNSQEVAAVVNFYADRLKDHHSVNPATIRGLLALVKMKNIEKEAVVQFLVPLFQEMNCQAQWHSDRYNIFSIIAYVVENHLEVVSSMGYDFIFGIISLADGETDPSNLLLLFKFLPIVLKNIELGHLMEEMFDLLSCYFPVDFNAAAENSSISRSELAEGLINCLASRPDFSNHCIPLIFEKLESTFKTARIDSYELLEACCKTYTVESMSKHSNEFWKIMQKDVLPAVDSEICDAALSALSEMVRLFASSEEKVLKNFLDDILITVRTSINKIDENLYHSAIGVLFAASRRSQPAARYVLQRMKFLFDNEEVKTATHRKTVLLSLAPFLPILKECGMGRSEEESDSVMFREISRIYLDSLDFAAVEIQKLAAIGIQKLVPDFGEDLKSQLHAIIAKHIKYGSSDDVRNECLNILRQLGEMDASVVLRLIETNFEMDADSGNVVPALSAFVCVICAIADIGNLTQYAVPRILNVVTTSRHFDVGLSNLLKCCERVDDEGNEFLKNFERDYNVTEKLIGWWIENESENNSIGDLSLKNLSEIIAIVVRHQETSLEQSIVDRYVPQLLNKIEIANGSELPIASSAETQVTERSTILLEAILGSVRQNVTVDKFPSLYGKLIATATHSDSEWIRTSASRLLASIINKRKDDSQLELVKLVSDTVFSSLDGSSSITEKINAVSLLSWVIKGMFLANSQHLEPLISKWFDMLEREDVGWKVAEGFSTVLREENTYLNMQSHCNIKILYRQRFFMYFARLMKAFEPSREEFVKRNYLSALTRIVVGVPKNVIATEKDSVIAVVSQALDSDSPDILIASLDILYEFLQDREKLLENFASSLIQKLLALARYDGFMKVRIAALKCLYGYVFLSSSVLLPFKNKVVRSLEPCLDDRKRLVRSEAVKARNMWFLVGAPGEDSIFPRLNNAN